MLRIWRWTIVAIMSVFAASAASAARADDEARVLDGFESPASWSVVTSDGVSLRVSDEAGRTGRCARLDYDFTRGSGYAIIRKELGVDLPANYRFSYFIRGEGPSNTVEFKLIDESGDNVWWVNQRDFHFPMEWSRVVLPKRKIGFAWGPSGGTPIRRARWIEIVVTSFNGGHGSVWLDDLRFEPLPEVRPYAGTPTVSASSVAGPEGKALALGERGRLDWSSGADDPKPVLNVEFGQAREVGGLIIDWGEGWAKDFDVLASIDGEVFETAARVRGCEGGRSSVALPDATAMIIRIAVFAASGGPGVTVRSLRFMPPEFGDSRNVQLAAAAMDAPRGRYPRYLLGEAAYWTVVGADGGETKALMGEEGAVEVGKLGFSLEPFVFTRDGLVTWNESRAAQTLEDGSLPIPCVRRSMPGLELEIKAFVACGGPEGNRGGSSPLCVRYELRNTDTVNRTGTLFVAIRPMQVNPSYQNLNITGGAAKVQRISREGAGIMVDGREVVSMPGPDGFGTSTLDAGEIVEHLATDKLPNKDDVNDPNERASGAMVYRFDLKPGESRMIGVLATMGEGPAAMELLKSAGADSIDRRLAETASWWRSRVGAVAIRLPPGHEQITDSVRANLAYMLVNRSGFGLQPGSRSYDRTWIRDGALMSSALLSMGLGPVVREFLDWYAPFQYENGKMPCCVDRRGPDPVPEHDSEGEYIYAVRTYFDYTGDKAFLAAHFPRVIRAVAYIESLRNQRMGGEYEKVGGEKRVFRGLMPESISHEGYSAKPMHSYWDDFWTMRGLVDAASLAESMGDKENAERFCVLRDSFERTLGESLRLAMAMKKIDYLPGCAELGDFDATSTTVALFPGGAGAAVPRRELENTFDRFWEFFRTRRDGAVVWKDYTPYETRIVGSMVLLGKRDRALEMLEFYLRDQRPTGWRQWPEVIRKDPREAGFIGDIPHSWVGADFINSVRLMLAYTRESDGALVLGAGLPLAWIDSPDGVKVGGLVTEYGALSYEAKSAEGAVRIDVRALAHPPKAGVVWSLPVAERVASVTREGAQIAVGADGIVKLGTLPATLIVRYRAKGE